MDQDKADKCNCHKQVNCAQQTISEMDFDRGIWNAAIYNDIERIKHFISQGKSMEKDSCNYTALHYAARNGNLEICKLLINEGKVDVNATTKGGVTSLHRAALVGNFAIVKLLVDSGANITLQNEDGETVLHRAAVNGNLQICEFLIDKQPNLKEIKDKKEKTPFQYILENSNDNLKFLLKP